MTEQPSRRRRRWDDDVKLRALRIAERLGAAQAEVETGVPAGTIRAWRSRGKVAWVAPKDGDKVREGLETPTDERTPAQVAREALREVQRLLNRGEHLAAQRASVTYGVLVDKACKLEERGTLREAESESKVDRRACEGSAKVLERGLDSPTCRYPPRMRSSSPSRFATCGATTGQS